MFPPPSSRWSGNGCAIRQREPKGFHPAIKGPLVVSLSLRDWRHALRRCEMQPMIASDATTQRAPPCPLDHPQLQPAGRAVRLCREPAARHRRLCQHGAARGAGGRAERGHPLFARDFSAARRLWSAPPPIAVSTLSRATLASLPGHHPALVLIASNLRVGITRASTSPSRSL